MGAVDNSETVLDVEVGAGGFYDILDKIGGVGFFARVEAEIFEEGDFGIGGDFKSFALGRKRVEADFLPG